MLWNTVARQLAGYDDLFGGAPVVPAYRAKALSILRPVWTRVGLMPKVGEASSTSQLREELIRLMPQLGDAAITTDIRAAMKAGFDDATKLPAAIRHPVQFAYGYTNDAAGWEALRQRAKAEKDPQIKQDDYAALANVNDPVLAQKTLDLALTEELPVPVRPQLLNTVSGNFPEMAFDFAVAHADTINALLEESTRAGFIVGLANGSNDSALADRVKAYAHRALAPQSRLAANTAIAGIRIRAKQRAELMPAFAAWVGSDAGTAKR
jgi:aminopeptidase N